MSGRTAEEAVLLDILNGDIDSADDRLADFFSNELRDFHDKVGLLESRIKKMRRAKSAAPHPVSELLQDSALDAEVEP